MELLKEKVNYRSFLEFYYNEFENGNIPKNIDEIVELSNLETNLIEIKEKLKQIKSDNIYSSLTLPLIPVLGAFLYNSDVNKPTTIITCLLLASYVLKDIYDTKEESNVLKLEQNNIEDRIKQLTKTYKK
ncbi:MAG: hypothetical protein IJ565_01555 [Bacilli bacterium]|nr:hypothetical protein [Bacilli bacterium]